MDTNNALQVWEDVAEKWLSALLENASSFALKLVWAVAAFIVMMIVASIISSMVKKAIIKHSTGNDEQAQKIWKLIKNLVYYILLWFGIFISFEILWFDVGLLLWWVSFGIGLAFKEVLWNMIAGIMILYTKEFRMWDVVEVQADEIYFGRIEEITVRYTIVRTLDLRQVIIPNLKMISVPIKTFSTEEVVKLATTIGIHYDSDVEKAIQVTVQAINDITFVKEKENTSVFVTNFGESSIDLKCLFFFDPQSGIVWDYAIGLVNEAINAAFKTNGIIIPYPHTTLTFHSEEDKLKMIQKSNTTPTANHIVANPVSVQTTAPKSTPLQTVQPNKTTEINTQQPTNTTPHNQQTTV